MVVRPATEKSGKSLNTPSIEYALTDLGQEMAVPVRALGAWVLDNLIGSRAPVAASAPERAWINDFGFWDKLRSLPVSTTGEFDLLEHPSMFRVLCLTA
jgi:hypothetical protein